MITTETRARVLNGLSPLMRLPDERPIVTRSYTRDGTPMVHWLYATSLRRWCAGKAEAISNNPETGEVK